MTIIITTIIIACPEFFPQQWSILTWRPYRWVGTSRGRNRAWRGWTRGWRDQSPYLHWSPGWRRRGRQGRWGTESHSSLKNTEQSQLATTWNGGALTVCHHLLQLSTLVQINTWTGSNICEQTAAVLLRTCWAQPTSWQAGQARGTHTSTGSTSSYRPFGTLRGSPLRSPGRNMVWWGSSWAEEASCSLYLPGQKTELPALKERVDEPSLLQRYCCLCRPEAPLLCSSCSLRSSAAAFLSSSSCCFSKLAWAAAAVAWNRIRKLPVYIHDAL